MSDHSQSKSVPCPACGHPPEPGTLHCPSCHAWLPTTLLSPSLARRIGLEFLSAELERLADQLPEASTVLEHLRPQLEPELAHLRAVTADSVESARTPPSMTWGTASLDSASLDSASLDSVPVLTEGLAPTSASSEGEPSGDEVPHQEPQAPLPATGGPEPKRIFDQWGLPQPSEVPTGLEKLALPPSLSLPRSLYAWKVGPQGGDGQMKPLEGPPRPEALPAAATLTVSRPQGDATPVSTPTPPAPRRTFTLPSLSETPLAEQPSGWEALQRLRAEHVVWGLGVLLTLVGSFYFVGSRWGTFSNLVQGLILFGSGLAYSGAFYAIGRLLSGRPGLELASRVMATVSLALWPALSLPGSRLMDESLLWGLLALAVGGGTGMVLVTRAIGLISAADVPTFARVFLPLSLLPSLLPLLERVGAQGLLPYLGLGFVFRALFLHNVSEGRARVERTWALALSAQAFGVLCASTLTGSGVSSRVLLPLLPLLGAGAFYLDLALGRWKGVKRAYFKEPPGILGLLLTGGGVLASLDAGRGFSALLTQGSGVLVLGLVALLYRDRWLMVLAQLLVLVTGSTLLQTVGFEALLQWVGGPSALVQVQALYVLPGLALLPVFNRAWIRLERPVFARDTLTLAMFVSTGAALVSVSGSASLPWALVLPSGIALLGWVFTQSAERLPLVLAWGLAWLLSWRLLGVLDLPPVTAVLLALGADVLGSALERKTLLPLGRAARDMALGGLLVAMLLSVGVTGLGFPGLPTPSLLALNLTLVGAGMVGLAARRHPQRAGLLSGAVSVLGLAGGSIPLVFGLSSHLGWEAMLALILETALLLSVAVQQARRAEELEQEQASTAQASTAQASTEQASTEQAMEGETPSPQAHAAHASGPPSPAIPPVRSRTLNAGFTALGLSALSSLLVLAFLPAVLPELMSGLRGLLRPLVELPLPLTLPWLAFFFWPLTGVWLGIAGGLWRWKTPRLAEAAVSGLGLTLALLASLSVLSAEPGPSLLGLPLLVLTAWRLSALTFLSEPLRRAAAGLLYGLLVLLGLQGLSALDAGAALKALGLVGAGVGWLEWGVRRPSSLLAPVRRQAGLLLLWLSLGLGGLGILTEASAGPLAFALVLTGAGMAWAAARGTALGSTALDGIALVAALAGAGYSVAQVVLGGYGLGDGALGMAAALLALLTTLCSSLGRQVHRRMLLFYPLLGVTALSIAKADLVSAARNEALIARALGYPEGILPLGWASLAVLLLAGIGLGVGAGLPRLEATRHRLTAWLSGALAEPTPPHFLERLEDPLVAGAQLLLLGLLASFTTPGLLPALFGLAGAAGLLLWAYRRRPWPVTVLQLQAVGALWVWAGLSILGASTMLQVAVLALLGFGCLELARMLEPRVAPTSPLGRAVEPLGGMGRAGLWAGTAGFAVLVGSASGPSLLAGVLALGLGLLFFRRARADRHPWEATASVGLFLLTAGLGVWAWAPDRAQLAVSLGSLLTLLGGVALWRAVERDRTAANASLLPQGLFSSAFWRLGGPGIWFSAGALVLELEPLLRGHGLERLGVAGLTALGLGVRAAVASSPRAAWAASGLATLTALGCQHFSGLPGYWLPLGMAMALGWTVLGLSPSATTAPERRGVLRPLWVVSSLTVLASIGGTSLAILEETLRLRSGWVLVSWALTAVWGLAGASLVRSSWPMLASWVLVSAGVGLTGYHGDLALGIAMGMGLAAALWVARRAGRLSWLEALCQRLGAQGEGFAGRALPDPEGTFLREPLLLGLLLGSGYQLWGLSSSEAGLLPALAVGLAGLAGAWVLDPSFRPLILAPLPALLAWKAGAEATSAVMLLGVGSMLSGWRLLSPLGSSSSLTGWASVGWASVGWASVALILAGAVGLGGAEAGSAHTLLHTPMWPVVVTCWTLTVLKLGLEQRKAGALGVSGSGIWVSAGVWLAWVGVLLGGGRPPLALLPPLGWVSLLLLGAMLLRGENLQARHGIPAAPLRRLYRLLAWITLAGGLFIPGPTSRELALECLAWLALGGLELVQGLREQRVGPVRRAELSFFMAWGVVRVLTPLGDSLAGHDSSLVAGLAVLCLLGSDALRRRAQTVLAIPMHELAAVLPGVALLLCVQEDRSLILPLAGAGGFYLLHFHLREQARSLLLGVGLLNVSMLLGWRALGVSDVQVYVMPLGLTALALAQKFRTVLPRAALRALRTGAMGLIFLASFYQSVLTPWSSALMLLIALGSVGAGVGLKVRSFVTLGALAVLVVLGMNLLRFGLAFPQFWALYLTLAGVAILGGMVAVSLQRERLTAALERLQSELEGWE